MPDLLDYIKWLQDSEYERAARLIVRGISAMTRSAGSDLLKAVKDLEDKAKDLEKLKADDVELSMALSEFKKTMNQTEKLIIANIDSIAKTGYDIAERAAVAKIFAGTTEEMIKAGVNPLSAEAFAYFMNAIKDTNMGIKSPDPLEMAYKYTLNDDFIKRMDSWGDNYSSYVENSIYSGMNMGWSPKKTASRLMELAKDLPMNAAYSIARTVQLQSYRDASAEMERLNGRFIAKKIRIAALDDRTCPACIALHGTEVPLGESIIDHYMGRCDAIYVPAGGDLPEYMQAMSEPGKRNFVPFQKGEDWFAKQQEAYQRKVLGNGKYELYKSGKISISDVVGTYHDDVFGDMPVVKPLWELEGFASYKDKLGVKVEVNQQI